MAMLYKEQASRVGRLFHMTRISFVNRHFGMISVPDPFWFSWTALGQVVHSGTQPSGITDWMNTLIKYYVWMGRLELQHTLVAPDIMFIFASYNLSLDYANF